jgi:hypothetical protein
MKVMFVQGPERAPEFISPMDALMLPPGLGEFSCCAMNHDFGDGPVPCDRWEIEKVLKLLVEAKIKHLEAEERWFELRYYVAVQHRFFEGLGGRDLHSTVLGDNYDAAMALSSASNAFITLDTDHLQALKTRLGWRSPTVERVDTKSTGASLLYWAAFADDLSSVRELLRIGDKSDVNRKLQYHIPGLSLLPNMTPLIAAMAFARWKVVEVLLDAGADPMAKCEQGLDALMWAAFLGNTINLAAWLKRYPQWNLEKRTGSVGLTVLHVAASTGTKQPVIELLIKAGANPMASAHNGGHVLSCVAANPDSTPELVQWILDYDDGLLRPLLTRSLPTLKWILLMRATRIMCYLGSCNKIARHVAEWEKSTVLHVAMKKGNLTTARVVVEAGAPLEWRSALGWTPFEITQRGFGGAPPQLLLQLLDRPPLA